MLTTILIIAVVFLAAALLFVMIWNVRTHRFKPNPDKLVQQTALNADLEPVGFGYERKGDYFYSLMDCWQREAGYCRLYDEGAPLFNIIIDCEPVYFSYGGKRWLIELWKGQYGITTGGEIGIYNTGREDIKSDKFEGTFYESISSEEMLPMSFILYKNGKKLIQRKGVHWWLTGFKLGEFSRTDALTMDASITFKEKQMKEAFLGGLREAGYSRKEYSVRGKTVKIRYTRTHSVYSVKRNFVQEAAVQMENENNCRLYELGTGRYKDTMDKLEYVKSAVPELYELFLKSLYAKGFYDAFNWIKEILQSSIPSPRPKPYPPLKPEPIVCPCQPGQCVYPRRPQPEPCVCPCHPQPEPCACPCHPQPEPCACHQKPDLYVTPYPANYEPCGYMRTPHPGFQEEQYPENQRENPYLRPEQEAQVKSNRFSETETSYNEEQSSAKIEEESSDPFSVNEMLGR